MSAEAYSPPSTKTLKINDKNLLLRMANKNPRILTSTSREKQKSQHTPYEDFAKSAWLSPSR